MGNGGGGARVDFLTCTNFFLLMSIIFLNIITCTKLFFQLLGVSPARFLYLLFPQPAPHHFSNGPSLKINISEFFQVQSILVWDTAQF